MFQSQLDDRVLEGADDGKVYMQTMDESNQNQLWVLTDFGDQAINYGTGLPLKAGKGRTWTLDDQGRIIDTRKPGKAMDRGWTTEDGAGPVGTWKKHGGFNQKWTIIDV